MTMIPPTTTSTSTPPNSTTTVDATSAPPTPMPSPRLPRSLSLLRGLRSAASNAAHTDLYLLVHTSGQRFKIGYSCQPEKRFATMPEGQRNQIDLKASSRLGFASRRRAEQVESAFHKIFDRHRVDPGHQCDGHTEWFSAAVLPDAVAILRVVQGLEVPVLDLAAGATGHLRGARPSHWDTSLHSHLEDHGTLADQSDPVRWSNHAIEPAEQFAVQDIEQLLGISELQSLPTWSQAAEPVMEALYRALQLWTPYLMRQRLEIEWTPWGQQGAPDSTRTASSSHATPGETAPHIAGRRAGRQRAGALRRRLQSPVPPRLVFRGVRGSHGEAGRTDRLRLMDLERYEIQERSAGTPRSANRAALRSLVTRIEAQGEDLVIHLAALRDVGRQPGGIMAAVMLERFMGLAVA